MLRTELSFLEKIGYKKNIPNLIKSLHLRSHTIDDKKLEELISALKDYPVLKQLDLSFNDVTDEGILNLVSGLIQNNVILTSLDLSFNRISDVGVIALAKLPLNSLFLAGNELTNNCVQYLLTNNSLLYVDLGQGMVDVKYKNQLQSSLTKNKNYKKEQFINEIIFLAHVARQRPNYFNQAFDIPLHTILSYLALDIKRFIPRNPLVVDGEVTRLTGFIFDKAYAKKLRKHDIACVKLYLSNQMPFEEVEKKIHAKDKCICM